MTIKNNHNWIRTGAVVLLSAPVGFIFMTIYTFNGRISAAEEKIITVEKNTEESKEKINQIHWYLIEKNNIVVPNKVKDE